MHERSESRSVIPHYPHVYQYCICFQAAHTHLIKGHFGTISLFQMVILVVLKLVSQRSFCFCTLFTFSHLFFGGCTHSFDPRFPNHDSVVAVWLLAEIWKWVFGEAVERVMPSLKHGSTNLPPAMMLDEFLDNVLCRWQSLLESLDNFRAACTNGNVSIEIAREAGGDLVPQ